jgi:MFS family permease
MDKKFYWIYITVFINIIGIGMVFPILPLFAKTFNASSFQVGLLIALLAFIQFLTAPLLGKLSDKYGRKPLLFF